MLFLILYNICILLFREIWPEVSYFGKPGLSNKDELDILKQIFHADIGVPIGIT